jgi:ABC-type branched-subunit amino acid transport system ATPase component
VAGGAQTTALLQLAELAPTVAAADGRSHVTFDDIAWLLPHVLRHRLIVDDAAYAYVLEKGRIILQGEGSRLLADEFVQNAYLGTDA